MLGSHVLWLWIRTRTVFPNGQLALGPMIGVSDVGVN